MPQTITQLSEMTHTGLIDALGRPVSVQEWTVLERLLDVLVGLAEPQVVTAPLADMSDPRGSVGALCFSEGPPKRLYHKVSTDPHRWVFNPTFE